MAESHGGFLTIFWDMPDIVKLVDAAEGKPNKRSPYKKRLAISD